MPTHFLRFWSHLFICSSTSYDTNHYTDREFCQPYRTTWMRTLNGPVAIVLFWVIIVANKKKGNVLN